MYSKISGPRYKTIFTVFNDHNLKNKLKKFAQENSYKIFLGEPFSPDIIVMPYFLSIVDRNILGIDSWNNYLKYNEEAEVNDEYCVIIDDRKDLKLPKFGEFVQISIVTNESVTDVINTCKNIARFSEGRRCFWALESYLSEKIGVELQEELLGLFKVYFMVKDCFYTKIVSKNTSRSKEDKLSNYFATRSEEEIRLFIKEQYRAFVDVQRYYIDKIKQLYFSVQNEDVYL